MVKCVGDWKKLHHFLTTFKPYIRTKGSHLQGGSVDFIALHKVIQLHLHVQNN